MSGIEFALHLVQGGTHECRVDQRFASKMRGFCIAHKNQCGSELFVERRCSVACCAVGAPVSACSPLVEEPPAHLTLVTTITDMPLPQCG